MEKIPESIPQFSPYWGISLKDCQKALDFVSRGLVEPVVAEEVGVIFREIEKLIKDVMSGDMNEADAKESIIIKLEKINQFVREGKIYVTGGIADIGSRMKGRIENMMK